MAPFSARKGGALPPAKHVFSHIEWQMIGYDIADTAGFPFDRETGTISGRGSCVIPVNLAENVRQLHEFLYENYDYTPSSEVQKISEQITADTGY